jgi:transcriptional regulator with GAF, ATPase, and Fis domain
MLAALGKARLVAPHNLEVLIAGETGTGKNMVALAIHNASPRRSKPFLALNVAAICGGTAESELFGHERGAFTNAVAERHGMLEQADGGPASSGFPVPGASPSTWNSPSGRSR